MGLLQSGQGVGLGQQLSTLLGPLQQAEMVPRQLPVETSATEEEPTQPWQGMAAQEAARHLWHL